MTVATKYIYDAGTAEYFAEKRLRNAEAVRKVFKAEAGRTGDACIEAAFATLAAAGDVEMLDRVMRSLRV